MRAKLIVAVVTAVVLHGQLLSAVPRAGVPAGCDPDVMSEAYWRVWNETEQARIDADIEANRKTDAVVPLDVPAGTSVTVEQLDHEFRFGAHIFNFNQLGKAEYNDDYRASYGRGGIFNQATVAFYWSRYEPTPGHRRAYGQHEDSEAYWNALSREQAKRDRYWRRPSPGPVIDFLKAKDVSVHGHILVWGQAKPYWIYDWYCPEEEKRAFEALGIPRHADFVESVRAGADLNAGFAAKWMQAWRRAYDRTTEAEIAQMAPVFTANMRKIFRKRIFDVAADFGAAVDSWDVVNESSLYDWSRYGKSKTGLPVWFSGYGLMPGDYPLQAMLDAKEAMPPRAKLAINDYNIADGFLTQVRQLEDEGAKVDIVGCQMHIFATNDCRRLAMGATNVNWVGTPGVIQDRLDMMAKADRPLHVSEITITSPGPDERSLQIQAVLVRNIYRKWFSHRAMMGITWWNTVDGGGYSGEPLVSGLFTRDMKKKPAYLALDELVNREWRTKCEAKVQGEGERRTVKFRGFRGKYRLSWTCPHCGRRHFQELWLTGDGDVRCGASTAEDECFVPVRSVTVDGRAPVWKVGEDILDLAALYPDAVEAGTDGTRWAEIACTLVAPRGGSYRLRRINDWWGRVIVNGEDQGALVGEADKGHPKVFEVKLRAGENRLLFKTRSGSGGQWIAGLFLPGDSTLTVK